MIRQILSRQSDQDMIFYEWENSPDFSKIMFHIIIMVYNTDGACRHEYFFKLIYLILLFIDDNYKMLCLEMELYHDNKFNICTKFMLFFKYL